MITGGIFESVSPHTTLFPKVKTRAQLSHFVQAQGIWTRTIVTQLNLLDDVSDVYTNSPDHQLDLQQEISAGVVRSSQLSQSVTLSQSVLVSGGRLDNGSGVGLPGVEYQSDVERGQPLYVPQAGEADLARADSAFTTRVMGLANASANEGEPGFFINAGWIDRPDWTPVTGSPSLVPNAYYYLSDQNAGKLQLTPPDTSGNFIVTVGLALDETTMFVSISQPIQL